MKTVDQRVIEAATKLLGMVDGDIRHDSTRESIGTDSLDDIEIIMAIEEEFNIEIPDEDAEQLDSIWDAVKYVERRLKALEERE